MNAENNFKQLEHEESKAVISFSNGATFKISKLMEILNVFFRDSVFDNLSQKLNKINLGSPPSNKSYVWNTHGVDAEILEPQSGEWKKGKVRMRVILEFCPDEPEIENNPTPNNNNLLDDIRQTII